MSVGSRPVTRRSVRDGLEWQPLNALISGVLMIRHQKGRTQLAPVIEVENHWLISRYVANLGDCFNGAAAPG